MKTLAALIETEECDIETSGKVTEFKAISENKTVTIVKEIENCKPFVT